MNFLPTHQKFILRIMHHVMHYAAVLCITIACLFFIGSSQAFAQYAGSSSTRNAATSARAKTFSSSEIVSSGHKFFGTVSRGLASVIEEAGSRWGEPTGYILGQEAAGAFVGGLRYGEGTLYTKDRGDIKIFWQGPSIGFDFGGDGDRTMMLVYKMRGRQALMQRFAGIDGSAYFIGGFGMTALTANDIIVVPIRSGVGARLGINIGYLKFTDSATWNPF